MTAIETAERFIDESIASGVVADGPDTRDDAQFGAVALEVFEYQYERIPLYRRLCELRSVDPACVRHWHEIPAAPADLFKEDLGVAEDAGSVVFASSGTTAGPGRRSHRALGPRSYDLYRRSSLAMFRAMVLPDNPGVMSVLVLGPTAATHPQSSLGHMYSFVADAVAARDGDRCSVACMLGADGNLDLDATVSSLEQAAAATRPVLLLALRSTMTAVFETLRARGLALRLPADSRLVETGGSKGARTLSRGGLLHAAWRFLHIPTYLCTGEYGMTELVSQFYDDALRSRWSGRLGPRAKTGPRWTRTVVVDPVTLEPLPRGERGLLRHVDLASCDAVTAVQTLDVGVETATGFEVLGRAEGSETRGCSQLMSVLSD
ncbi:MAG TPA: hypothetical protein VGK20_07570 [Candidatus Binatia bacterium]